MFLLFAILFPLLTGLVLSVGLIVRNGHWKEWLLALVLAPGLGIAVSSALYFLWTTLVGPTENLPLYLALEGLVLALTVTLWRVLDRAPLRFIPPNWKRLSGPAHWPLRTWLGLAAAVVLGIAAANFLENWLLTFFAAPNGEWDAWFIWNLHARFIASGSSWLSGFSPLMNTGTHPDYPLLLPAFVARMWVLLGSQSQLVPALVELFFMFSILGLILTGVLWIKGWKSALFAGLFTLPVLALSLEFQQYADMPLAFFFLLANLMLWLASRRPLYSARCLVLAGLAMGAALWTKNEGWAFLLAFALVEGVRFLINKPGLAAGGKRWLWIGAGLVPFLVITLLFKGTIAPTNDLVSSFSPMGIWDKLTQGSNYALIYQDLRNAVFSSTILLKVPLLPALIGYILLTGWEDADKRRGDLLEMGLRILGVGVIYFVIYLLTPYSLSWHLATSLTRLMAHLLPSLVLLAFLLAGSLDSPQDPS